MKKTLVLTLLALTLTAVSASAYNWFSVRIRYSARLIGTDNTFLPMMTYHVLDGAGDTPACFLVIRDDATGQMIMSRTEDSACR